MEVRCGPVTFFGQQKCGQREVHIWAETLGANVFFSTVLPPDVGIVEAHLRMVQHQPGSSRDCRESTAAPQHEEHESTLNICS